jgi:hypothetical protein
VQNADTLVRRCALATDATVVLATPVDTGRARSNWQVECNSPAQGVIEPLTTVQKGHRGSGGAVARAAIEKGKEKIAQYKGGTPQAAIYITNNLPYIGALNDGHSAQAPSGFVERAVMVGINAVHSAAGRGFVSKQVSRSEPTA